MSMHALVVCASLIAYDGDTVLCDGEHLRIMGPGSPFVSGVDTPEMNGRCKAERMLAEIAKKRLAEILAGGVKIEDSGKRDNTSRSRRLVWLHLPDGSTAGEKLLKEGLAIEWRPGRKANWCG